MMKWQYKLIESDYDSLIAKLNKAGADGWEALYLDRTARGDRPYCALLKREAQPEPEPTKTDEPPKPPWLEE